MRPKGLRSFFKAGQRDVGEDRQGHGEAKLAAVFGDISQSEVHRLLRGGDADLLVCQRDRALGRRSDAEEGKRDIGPAGANETGEAEDFAFGEVEADAAEDAVTAEVLDGE